MRNPIMIVALGALLASGLGTVPATASPKPSKPPGYTTSQWKQYCQHIDVLVLTIHDANAGATEQETGAALQAIGDDLRTDATHMKKASTSSRIGAASDAAIKLGQFYAGFRGLSGTFAGAITALQKATNKIPACP